MVLSELEPVSPQKVAPPEKGVVTKSSQPDGSSSSSASDWDIEAEDTPAPKLLGSLGGNLDGSSSTEDWDAEIEDENKPKPSLPRIVSSGSASDSSSWGESINPPQSPSKVQIHFTWVSDFLFSLLIVLKSPGISQLRTYQQVTIRLSKTKHSESSRMSSLALQLNVFSGIHLLLFCTP